jgi:hypothetical protein
MFSAARAQVHSCGVTVAALPPSKPSATAARSGLPNGRPPRFSMVTVIGHDSFAAQLRGASTAIASETSGRSGRASAGGAGSRPAVGVGAAGGGGGGVDTVRAGARAAAGGVGAGPGPTPGATGAEDGGGDGIGVSATSGGPSSSVSGFVGARAVVVQLRASIRCAASNTASARRHSSA